MNLQINKKNQTDKPHLNKTTPWSILIKFSLIDYNKQLVSQCVLSWVDHLPYASNLILYCMYYFPQTHHVHLCVCVKQPPTNSNAYKLSRHLIQGCCIGLHYIVQVYNWYFMLSNHFTPPPYPFALPTPYTALQSLWGRGCAGVGLQYLLPQIRSNED